MEIEVTMLKPKEIGFNFDEIKTTLVEKADQYTGLVYTDETIKEAKADLAELRKFSKAMSDKRIEIKKTYLVPYEEFEAKIKELDAILQKPISEIDAQVKAYEEKLREEKSQAINEYWNSKTDLDIELVFDKKWLNATTSIKSVYKDIDTLLDKVQIDLATLSNLPEFGFEATEVYKHTLDITQAIKEGQRLADIQKRKQEAKDKVQEFDVPSDLPFEGIEENFIPDFNGNIPIMRVYHIELTTNQKLILEQFLKVNNIRFEEE